MKRETTLLISSVLALVLVGVLMVYSASSVRADAESRLERQLVYVAIGLTVMFFAARFDYHRLRDRPIFRGVVLLSLALLGLVLLPGAGVLVDGAQRWVRIGGFQFQPSEVAKFALILLLAVKLTDNRQHIHRLFRGFIPPMLISALFAGLVLAERDLGVPVMMFGVAFVMLCAAGVRWGYLLASFVPACAAVLFLVLAYPHRLERLLAFLNPWDYRKTAGWQLIQSLSAFARGSLTGLGAGAGEQKLGYLPAADTDFIFAVVGEELGLAGTLCVTGLFAALAVAGYRIAMNAEDQFGSLLATGIVALIAGQATFIMAVTTGLLPTKGLPLPFVSYGGTALIVFLGLAGILVNIGVQAHEQQPERKLMPTG